MTYIHEYTSIVRTDSGIILLIDGGSYDHIDEIPTNDDHEVSKSPSIDSKHSKKKYGTLNFTIYHIIL